MIGVLANGTYRRLFLAQVLALTGTGLATVALALLAYELAGADAGVVLGGALAIKMVAYVAVAPIASAFADRLPRRAFLVAMDLARGAVAMALPFVDQVWQVYVLIFLLQSASAAFTPTFQATIPDILPDEKRYTRALSLSRLAYDLESLASPMLAAVLLSVVSFSGLFAGTAVGFLASAALVLTVRLPAREVAPRRESTYPRTTRGVRIYLKTPRLRGLLALNLAAAAGGAMVIVNSVVVVRVLLGRPEADVPLLLAAFGLGSMVTALALPRLLDRLPDRPVMFAGAGGLVLTLIAVTLATAWATTDRWLVLLGLWFLTGLAYSAVLTPSGRLLKRSAAPADRPALFAAQFALSHVCWLATYLLAGWLGSRGGLPAAAGTMAVLALAGLGAAVRLWPRSDADVVEHEHRDLAVDHPHLQDVAPTGARRHAHAFVIDDTHTSWPRHVV